MNYESMIIEYIVSLGVYLFLNNTIFKESNFKTKTIFSYSLFLVITVLKALSYLDENDNKLIEDIILLSTLISSLNIILYLNYNSQSNINVKKLTYLKGRKILYVTLNVLSFLILIISLISTDFKSYSGLTIVLTVLFIGSVIWSLYYFREQTKQNFTKEIIMIYNDLTYVRYDVSKNIYFNLYKLVKSRYNISKEESFMIYLKEDNVNKLVWNFYSPDIVIEKNKYHNDFLFDTMHRLKCTTASIDLDVNEVNIIL